MNMEFWSNETIRDPLKISLQMISEFKRIDELLFPLKSSENQIFC